MKDKISVTGSKGFIGSWLCSYLQVPNLRRFDLETGDDLLYSTVQDLVVNRSDVIIHLAALSGLKACNERYKLADMVNHEATIQLAEKAKAGGVKRFIFASSSSVYGEAYKYLIDETHLTRPRNVYGETKLKAERISFLADDSFEVVILRKSNVYCFGMKWKGETVIDKFIESYLRKESIKINGTGTQKRDFVHIMDVVSLYGKIAMMPKVRSGIYNIGGTETISIRALAHQINDVGEAVFGYRVPIESIEGPTGAGWHDFKYDFSLAKMEFQYNPVFYIDDYLKERFLYEQRQKELKKR